MKTIFITAASQGIGRATVKLFVEKGWFVIATMRNPKKETEFINYKNIVLYELDVTNKDQIEKVTNDVFAKYDVDVLFNNAGFGMKCKFEDMTEELIEKSTKTNLYGMIYVTQKFIPYFKKKRSGVIATTTSIVGEIGIILDGMYLPNKWAVSGINEMLYLELAPYNIQVKTIAPGVVKTNFVMEHLPTDEYNEMIKKTNRIISSWSKHWNSWRSCNWCI